MPTTNVKGPQPNIAIIGGGPGGLYSGLLLKKADPRLNITIFERNPRRATYGWGVVFSDRTLSAFREADVPTYRAITGRFVLWDAIDVRYRGRVIRCGGHVFAGLARRELLKILQNRCRALGVSLQFETEVTGLETVAGADLIIAADGVNSMVRRTFADVFKPDLDVGRARYIWYGTSQPFDAFTFIFRENEHGLFQVHAYPFDGQTSTFIIECSQSTWRRAGLDAATEADSIAYCQNLFAPDLGSHRLMSNKSRWINFVRVKNRVWHHNNIVLLGDAVHTAHFSIGSGTKLAMEDAIALATAVEQNPGDLETALTHYEMERRPRVEALQAAALESRTYFENVERYLHLEPEQFTFHLLTRSGRLSRNTLMQRDPAYVEAVDRRFAAAHAGQTHPSPPALAPPPLFNPLTLRGMTLANRLVLASPPADAAQNGLPADAERRPLVEHVAAGAALLLTGIAAVSDAGRITPACAGMYCDAHAAAWKTIVDEARAAGPARLCLQLGHAGRRGSTRPRRAGLDRPLLAGNWPLLSASALPYAPWSQTPKAMTRADMDAVTNVFVEAATLAHRAGFDMLQLHAAHGYLLASFLSPLSNTRRDRYGGSPENRARFPLELFEAVRAAWPDDKPLSVALCATDWASGGATVDEASAFAAALKPLGCDMVEVLAGQTTFNARPVYGPQFLTPFSDAIRNRAGIAVMVGGHITTTDQANSILAAGRADLCIMAPPHLHRRRE